MPESMRGTNAPQTSQVTPTSASSVRERKKAETEARHQKWQAKYDQLRAENPKWEPSKAIKRIETELGVPSKTIRNNIKIR
ncbi:MAG TPA: hypothetical protein VIH90_03355, partial [Candidatus Saccharimonadales bacterium]